MPDCEFDGEPLTYDSEGREEACATCEVELAAHRRVCRSCRIAPNLPDDMSNVSVEALAEVWT